MQGVATRLRAAVVLVVLVVTGCFKRPADVPDDGDVPGDGSAGIAECVPASGSRIKVVVRRHTDNSQQFVRLIDADTGRECRFVAAGDGKTRCMPFSDKYSDGFVAYLSSSCTTPILGIYTNRYYPTELFVGNDGPIGGGPGLPLFGGSACTAQRRVFAIGNALSDPTQIFVRDGAGGCVAQQADNFIYDFYAAGTEKPATDFVEGVATRLGGGRIQLEVTDGTEGSRSCRDTYTTFRDTMLDIACSPAVAYDDVPRCMPTGAYFAGSYYTDSGCTTQ